MVIISRVSLPYYENIAEIVKPILNNEIIILGIISTQQVLKLK